jgi:hypothetical protein
VLVPNDPGDWEGIRVFNPEVIPRSEGFAMWYSALGNDGSFFGGRVGYATSADGLTWRKRPGNPVLEPTYPSCDVADHLVVIVDGDMIHGWYNHCSDITYANSSFEVFSDGFESGDTSAWSGAVP